MARIARVVAPGYPHHVTQRGNRRQRTFFGDENHAAHREENSKVSPDSPPIPDSPVEDGTMFSGEPFGVMSGAGCQPRHLGGVVAILLLAGLAVTFPAACGKDGGGGANGGRATSPEVHRPESVAVERPIDEESVRRALLEFVRSRKGDLVWRWNGEDLGPTEDTLEGALRKADWASDECWELGRWMLRWKGDKLTATYTLWVMPREALLLRVYLQEEGGQFRVVTSGTERMFIGPELHQGD